jgi:flagellar biosynthesis repressor protein FlbT
MQIHLKRGEKVYVNGAVIKAQQRCSLEFLNNVTFLLQNHVMQSEAAKTPFQQLYFVIQTLLIDPENESLTRTLYWHLSDCLRALLESDNLLDGLKCSDDFVKSQRYFDALKMVRGLLKLEEEVMKSKNELAEFIPLDRAVA